MRLQFVHHNVGPWPRFGKSTFVFLDKLGEDGKRKNRAANELAARFVVSRSVRTLKFEVQQYRYRMLLLHLCRSSGLWSVRQLRCARKSFWFVIELGIRNVNHFASDQEVDIARW